MLVLLRDSILFKTFKYRNDLGRKQDSEHQSPNLNSNKVFLKILINTSKEQCGSVNISVLFNVLILKGVSKVNKIQRFQDQTDMNSIFKNSIFGH